MRTIPPVTLRSSAVAPLLLTCEHAGRLVPRPLRVDAATRALLATHRGWDIGIWEVTRQVSAMLHAPAIGGRCSRLVTDLNRAPHDPTLALREADGVAVRFNRDAGAAEIAGRVRALHAPYHRAIDRQCRRLVRRGGRPLLVSMHSFTPLLNPARRRFDVGVLYAADAPLARRLGSLLAREGFSVRYNRPYSAFDGLIYAVSLHGARHGLPHLELEFNQRLLLAPRNRRLVAKRAARALMALFQINT
jgi:predicted N-formylglutamate amidohydrolase